MQEPTESDRTEHSYCVRLMGSDAFRWYADYLQSRKDAAVSATIGRASDSREYNAGRAAGLEEALMLVSRRYAKLKDLVEVIE